MRSLEQLRWRTGVPLPVLLLEVIVEHVSRDGGHAHVGVPALHAALELVDLVEAREPLAHRARPAREQAGDVLGRVVLLSHVQNL